MTGIDPLRTTAEEIAARLAAREVSCTEVAGAYLERIESLDPDLHVFLHVDPERTLADAARLDAAGPTGLQGVPIALKDLLCTRDVPATAALADPRGLPAAVRRDRRASSCATRARHRSASSTWTSSRWDRRPRTRRTARRATRGTRRACRADRAAARRPRSPPVSRRWRSAPTPAARSASPRRCAASSGSSRRTARSRGTARSRSRRRSTRSGRSRARCATPRCCSQVDRGPRPARLHLARRGRRRRRRCPRRRRRQRPAHRRARRVTGVEGDRARGARRVRASARTRSALEAAAREVDRVSLPRRHALAAYYLIAPAEASSNLARYDGVRYGLRVDGDDVCSTSTKRPRDAGLRPRGQAPHHARHLRAVGRLLRRVLREGAAGAHADHRATSTRVFEQFDVCSRRRRRPSRSSSARRPTIRSRCTWRRVHASREPRRPARRSACRAGSARRPADRRAAARHRRCSREHAARSRPRDRVRRRVRAGSVRRHRRSRLVEQRPDAGSPSSASRSTSQLRHAQQDVLRLPRTSSAPSRTRASARSASAHPGSLPVLNRPRSRCRSRSASRCSSTIARAIDLLPQELLLSRLPKDYQISQYDEPLVPRRLARRSTARRRRAVRFVRAHLEEDAGKTMHVGGGWAGSTSSTSSVVDFNRAGMPLLEIVSEPDLRTAEAGARVPRRSCSATFAGDRRLRREHGRGLAALRRQRLGAPARRVRARYQAPS